MSLDTFNNVLVLGTTFRRPLDSVIDYLAFPCADAVPTCDLEPSHDDDAND